MRKVSTVIGAVLSGLFMFAATSFLLDFLVEWATTVHQGGVWLEGSAAYGVQRVAILIISSATATFTFRASCGARTGRLYRPMTPPVDVP